MIRHDITAGLFAPVELLVTEDSHQLGTTVTYVRPSSLMVIETNVPLLHASRALDAKLAALVTDATDVAEEHNEMVLAHDGIANFMEANWPDIEANLRAAGELLEAVEALGFQRGLNMADWKSLEPVVAAAQKLREATK